MPEAFETFIRDPSDLVDGEETVLVLRDLTPGRRKYFAQNVVAIVSHSPRPSRDSSLFGSGPWSATWSLDSGSSRSRKYSPSESQAPRTPTCSTP